MSLGSHDKPLVVAGFADAISAPETAWSLIDDGFRVAMFARAGVPNAIGSDPNVEVLHVNRPEGDAARSAREMAELIQRIRPDVLLPLDSASMYLFDQIGAPDGCAPAYPVGTQARLATDDRVQVAAAEQAKLAVPPTAEVIKGVDLREVGHLPAEIRPALHGNVKHGKFTTGSSCYFSTRDEIEAAVPSWGDRGAALAWPPLQGERVTLVGAMTLAGKLAGATMVRWVRTAGGAPAACETVETAGPTVRHAENMLRDNGWRGYAEIDFIRTPDGTDVFQRLRAGLGPVSALVRPLGLDFAAWQARQAVDMGFEPPPVSVAPGLVCRHMGLELAHAADTLLFKTPAGIGDRFGALLGLIKRGGDQAWCNRRPIAKDVTKAETWRVARAFRSGKAA